MVKTIDATTTDRLRRSPLYLDLSPSCARTASLHGVNHNMPFPTALKFLFSTFSMLSPKACFQCADTLPFAAKHAKGMSLRYGVIVFERHPTKKSFYPQGFSTGPYSCQKSFLLLKKCAFFTFFVGFVGFFLFLVYICGNFFKVNHLAFVPT